MRHYVLQRRILVYAGVHIQEYRPIYTRMYRCADKAIRFEFGTDIGTDTSCVRATNSPQFRRGYCAVSELYGPDMTVS